MGAEPVGWRQENELAAAAEFLPSCNGVTRLRGGETPVRRGSLSECKRGDDREQ